VAQPTTADSQYRNASDPTPIQPPHVIRAALRHRRAHLVRHRGQSLEQHLFNTFHILTAWRQPPRVRYAGLLHSVYSTDVFTHPTFAVTERDQVRALVGPIAERLIHLFCVIDRRELLASVRAKSLHTDGVIELGNRLGSGRVRITGDDMGDLLAIHMANAAEQTCRQDRSPAGWLSHVSSMGRDARQFAEVVPPVFCGCTTVVSKTEENQLLSCYKQLVARCGAGPDPSTGTSPLEWPFLAEPLIWLGFDAIAHSRADEARTLGGVAAVRLEQWGTPWDKRLGLQQWMRVCAALRDTTKFDELAFVAQRISADTASVAPSPERLYLELASSGLLPAMTTATTTSSPTSSDVRPLPARFATFIAGLRSNHDKPRMTTYPGLQSTPFHNPKRIELVRDLERAADKIAKEMRELASQKFQEEAENIDRTGRWSVLFLYERGRKNEDNCRRCPETVAVIESNRTVLSLGGLAYFSRLEPGTHIAPHAGPTNIRLRCHLGIDVPEGCGLRVGGVTRTWEQGRCIVFDDSFTHEAWNNGDRDRVVLVVDLWHPGLSDDEVLLLTGLHRYATAAGVNVVRYWNRNRAKAQQTQNDRRAKS
jgi:hypothetical protein